MNIEGIPVRPGESVNLVYNAALGRWLTPEEARLADLVATIVRREVGELLAMHRLFPPNPDLVVDPYPNKRRESS